MQFWERTYLNYIYRQFNAIYQHPQGKVVLTFDDGPAPEVTPQILEVLSDRNIQAYFFLLGDHLHGNEDLLALYKKNKQIIGLHSKTHLPVNMNPGWHTEHKQTMEVLKRQGITVSYARPPYGLFHKAYLNFLKSHNLHLLMWNHTTYDYKSANTKEWAFRVASQTKKGDILLMHDAIKTAGLYPDGLNYLLDEFLKRKIEVGIL